MKVMHVLDLYANKLGGIEEFLIKQSTVVKNQNGQSIVVLRGYSKEVLDLMISAGAQVSTISDEPTSFAYLKKLAVSVFKNKPDLIVFHFFGHRNISPTLIGFITGIPCIFVDHHSGEGQKSNFKRAISWLIHQFSLFRFAKIIAVSNFVRNRQIHRSGLPEEKVKVIYNGTRPANNEEIQKGFKIRKELGLSEDTFVVMGISQLIKEKGFHILIEAFSNLKIKDKKLHLVIVGDGPERQSLQDQASTLKLNNVSFLGHRGDVQSLHWMADTVICPSIWAEAFGLIIIEAMINQRAVIATSVGGIPELIENEISGLLIQPEDIVGLQTAIERVISDPKLRQDLGMNAKKRALEKFHIDLNVKKSLELFHEVLDAKL